MRRYHSENINNISTTYQIHTTHIPIAFQLHTDNILRTGHIPTTYGLRYWPHTDQLNLLTITRRNNVFVCLILVMRCSMLQPNPHTIKSGCVSVKDHNTFGDVCSFFCDPGYLQVKGFSKRRCGADGNWSGAPLECQSKISSRFIHFLSQIIITTLYAYWIW